MVYRKALRVTGSASAMETLDAAPDELLADIMDSRTLSRGGYHRLETTTAQVLSIHGNKGLKADARPSRLHVGDPR